MFQKFFYRENVFYDWSQSLTSDVYFLSPSRMDITFQAYMEPIKSGGRNPRVLHEGGLLFTREVKIVRG